MGIEAILALVGLALPPVVDFIKKKFLKPGQDSPEATLSTLATTSPAVMPQYVEALAKQIAAKTQYFNRDISGVPSQWIIDLRAAIRPIGVITAFMALFVMALAMYVLQIEIPESAVPVIDGTRYACVVIVSSWFGDRLSQ
jgi:hypothetical protein